jgi:hypothetical protein
VGGADLKQLYNATRGEGLGPEVRRRILMGTYALSAGYYDAYYKRAQQVRSEGKWPGGLWRHRALPAVEVHCDQPRSRPLMHALGTPCAVRPQDGGGRGGAGGREPQHAACASIET